MNARALKAKRSAAAKKPQYGTTAERLAAKCVPGLDGCVVWTGSKNEKGYGMLRHNGVAQAEARRL